MLLPTAQPPPPQDQSLLRAQASEREPSRKEQRSPWGWVAARPPSLLKLHSWGGAGGGGERETAAGRAEDDK